ncbi:MAG: hypothetical protein Q9166_006893 [cf. Caloplaca sp. 2 TL-2023]
MPSSIPASSTTTTASTTSPPCSNHNRTGKILADPSIAVPKPQKTNKKHPYRSKHSPTARTKSPGALISRYIQDSKSINLPPTAANLSPCPTSAPASTNERVRDNQRRSRARRKEYISELEAKVRSYEKRGVEATAEMQGAARRVFEENTGLREEMKVLREEMGVVGGENEVLGEENRVLVEENARLREELRTWRGKDDRARMVVDDREEGGEPVVRKEGGEKGRVRGKRKREHQDAGDRKKQDTMCGFGGLTECTGPGCGLKDAPSTQSLQTAVSEPQPTPSTSTASSTYSYNYTQQAGAAYPSPPHRYHPPPLPSVTQPPPPPPQRVWSQKAPKPPLQPSTATEGDMAEDTDTSSCHLAAQIITSMRSDISLEHVRHELGCSEREEEECKVRNQQLLSVMDKFA